MAQAENVIKIMGQRIAQLETERAILAADLSEAQEQIKELRQQAKQAVREDESNG